MCNTRTRAHTNAFEDVGSDTHASTLLSLTARGYKGCLICRCVHWHMHRHVHRHRHTHITHAFPDVCTCTHVLMNAGPKLMLALQHRSFLIHFVLLVHHPFWLLPFKGIPSHHSPNTSLFTPLFAHTIVQIPHHIRICNIGNRFINWMSILSITALRIAGYIQRT